MPVISTALVVIIGAAALMAGGALVGGTIVWLIWPYAIPVIFPAIVAQGWVIAEIPWWSAVCFTWVCGILIKSSQTNNNK